jgi:hypothetical protein
MSFNSAGVFNRLYNWVTDAANGINVQADRMDNEMNGFADGLSLCLTRDSRAAMIADLKMGGFGIVNLKDPVNDQDAATKKFVQSLITGYTGAVVADAAPANPVQGQLWFRTSAPIGLYTWVQDATSGAWKIASGEYSVPAGMIMIWSGLLTALPVGWKLCDGSNGTPNLKDKFVIGAGGNYAKDATGGKTAITEVPRHSHGAGTLAIGAAGGHTHTISPSSHTHTGTQQGTKEAAIHVPGSTGLAGKITSGVTTGSVSLSLSTDGSHTHPLTGAPAEAGVASVDIMPPYYALAYIMKT